MITRRTSVAAFAAALVLALAWTAQSIGQPARPSRSTLEERVALLEARVSKLERLLEARREPPRRNPEERREAEEIPPDIKKALDELYPSAEVLDSGRHEASGNWWFLVRDDGKLYDIELSDAGKVLKNRRIAPGFRDPLLPNRPR